MKWDDQRRCVAGANVTFVDDGQGSGRDLEHAWQVLHCCATRFQHLGIQAALGKVRPPSQTLAAWAGCTLRVTKIGSQRVSPNKSGTRLGILSKRL